VRYRIISVSRKCVTSVAPLRKIGDLSSSAPKPRRSRWKSGACGQPRKSRRLPNTSAPISSAELAASRIGAAGTPSCSAAARSSVELAETIWPASNASNFCGIARHAASASAARVKPTGSYPTPLAFLPRRVAALPSPRPRAPFRHSRVGEWIFHRAVRPRLGQCRQPNLEAAADAQRASDVDCAAVLAHDPTYGR
jgi:hypothetical protein